MTEQTATAQGVPDPGIARPARSFWRGTLSALIRDHTFEFLVSGVIVVAVVALALLAPLIEPAPPNFQDAHAVKVSPNLDHQIR